MCTSQSDFGCRCPHYSADTRQAHRSPYSALTASSHYVLESLRPQNNYSSTTGICYFLSFDYWSLCSTHRQSGNSSSFIIKQGQPCFSSSCRSFFWRGCSELVIRPEIGFYRGACFSSYCYSRCSSSIFNLRNSFLPMTWAICFLYFRIYCFSQILCWKRLSAS